MRDRFYIFLDIDGVMFDWRYIVSKPRKGGIINDFNPESVKALNMLMDSLSKEYKTRLVITSTWRRNMQDVFKAFRDNGVNMTREVMIDSTRIGDDPSRRGEEILSYLGGSKEGKNFVIIDDESFDFDKHFEKSSIIKTSMANNSLNCEMVSNYLNSIGLTNDNEM